MIPLPLPLPSPSPPLPFQQDNWNAYSSFYIFNHFHFTIGVHSLHQGSLAWEIESVKLTLVGCPAPPCASMSHPEGLLLLRKHDAPFNMVMSYAVEFVVSWVWCDGVVVWCSGMV